MEAKQVITNGFLRQPKAEEIEALFHLENNKDFKVILNWMMSSSGDVDNVLRNVDSETMFHRAQGASRVMLAFCHHASNPADEMARIARKRAGVLFPGEQPEAQMPTIDII